MSFTEGLDAVVGCARRSAELLALPSTYSFSPRTRLPGALTHAAPRMPEIHAKLREARTNPLTAALAFVLDRPEVDIVVIGVTSVAELDQIIDAPLAQIVAR
jgi:aryl-alcohol dehydrogenase-like predicted oxidoreductase